MILYCQINDDDDDDDDDNDDNNNAPEEEETKEDPVDTSFRSEDLGGNSFHSLL